MSAGSESRLGSPPSSSLTNGQRAPRGWPRASGGSLLRWTIIIFASAYCVVGCTHVAVAQSAPTLRTEANVMVPMRDGVRLATNLFLPQAPGRYPTILMRTPYGKAEAQSIALLMAQSGWAAAWQDVRGRFDSEGEWEPFVHEAADGQDSIGWVARQPWSNGDVVMFGGSYGGLVQWMAAKGHSPHLKGLIVMVAPGDIYDDFVHEGGSFLFGAGVTWGTFVDGKRVNIAELTQPALWDKVFRHLPVSEALTVVGRNPKFYLDWTSHPNLDPYWEQMSWTRELPGFDFPVLYIGGWFDIFQKGTLENFRKMTSQAPVAARAKQHLVVGPWAHQGQEGAKVGEVGFGPDSTLNLATVLGTWLRHYFPSGGSPTPKPPAVRVFTMGENKWHEYEAWPVPSTKSAQYFFHSNGQANTAAGDGSLRLQTPTKKARPDRYIYDPANPVATRGGGNCCWPGILPWGPYDQREIEQRQDVLVYTSQVLEDNLRVGGPVEVKLWVSSSARDTDFTAKLVDVSPDGRAMNLTDGIQRAAYRESFRKPKFLKPGKPVELTIDLWHTNHVFLKGHRIRVEISSSNFPRYSRNLNTGRVPENETEIRRADQVVYHDAKRPSRIVLPVLPE